MNWIIWALFSLPILVIVRLLFIGRMSPAELTAINESE